MATGSSKPKTDAKRPYKTRVNRVAKTAVDSALATESAASLPIALVLEAPLAETAVPVAEIADAQAAPLAPIVEPAPLAPPIVDPIDLPAPVQKLVEPITKTVTKTIKTTPKTVAVPSPAAPLQKDIKIMEATIKTAADKTQAMFAEANDRAKAAMEKGAKAFEDMNEFGKGNIEAIVESGKIAAKGIETMGQEAAEYGRKHIEGATAAMKSFASVKSPTDFFKLQSEYVRSAFDSIVAETSKNTEAMLKLAGEVAQPISSRVAVAAEKIKIAA